MKTIFIALLLLAGTLAEAQSAPNRFNNQESETDPSSAVIQADGDAVTTGIGFEDDVDDETVPIDQYLPLLVLVAVAMVFYFKKKNRLDLS